MLAGLLAIAILTVVALWLVQHQIVILRYVAVAAIIVTLAAVVGVIVQYRASRIIFVRWPLLLIVTDTLIAWAPRLISKPPFVDHRYDNLSAFIPADGDLSSRIAFLKRTYGLGLVAHVIEQNIGVALAICIAAVTAIMAWRTRPRATAAMSVGLGIGLILAFVMTLGAISAGYSRLGYKRVWTVSDASGAAGGQFAGQAPPVAIERGRNGVLELLAARCGQERILQFSIRGAPAASLNFGRGEIATLRLPTTTAVVTITLSSTRYYRSQVIFKYLPKPGEFVSARPGVTHADFVCRGFCLLTGDR